MEGTVLYDSVTGHSERMAEAVAEGMRRGGLEARAFPVEGIDTAFAKESRVIVLGGPVYSASVGARLRAFLEKGFPSLEPAGKLGGAFATADYVHGGGEIFLQQVLTHMLCRGMLCYSGGSAFGRPVIHLGPVAISDALSDYEEVFRLYGERMAGKALELFK